MRRARAGVGAGALALAALLAAAGPASAATLPVTSGADTGEGTLRAAVAAAADGDVIKIAAGVNPTLTSGEIVIGADVTISGQSASATTVSAGGSSRIFRLGGASVTIEDLALSGGRAADGANGGSGLAGSPGDDGGAILNPIGSSLTLRRLLVVNSAAGSGGAGGAPLLPILDAGAGGNGGHGGALASFGDLVVKDSTFGGSRAGNGGAPGAGGLSEAAGGAGGSGGALYVIGGAGRTTTLENVTIASNAAGNGSSGANAGRGGAIFADGGGAEGAITIRHATISANRAGSGASAGGGGVFAGTPAGVLAVENSILAGNTAGNCSGANVGDGGNNISFESGGCPEGFSDANPGLDKDGPAKNGGPTPTIAISSTGAALNKVAPSGEHCATQDQRGIPRPQGANCDIGAFELKAPDCEDVAATVRPGGKVKVNLKCDGGPGTVTYLAPSEPERGLLSGFDKKDGAVTYEAPRRFRGTDTFTYAGENVVGSGARGTVTITIDGPFPPSNKIRFGKVSLHRDAGTATLPVTVPGPGVLRVSGKGVRNVSRTAKKKGRVKLPVKPIKQARKRLKRHGVATVTAKVSFRPRGGFTRTRRRDVRLRVNSFFVPI